MNRVESPIQTLIKFSSDIGTEDASRRIADLISISNETNRKSDTYYYILQEGKLIDPATKKPVEDFVSQGIEGDVFKKLQDWANDNDSGLAIWISPVIPGVYPSAKVIISRIAYDLSGNKIVLNSANLFENEVENPEGKRATLYKTNDSEEKLFKIISWLTRKNEGKPIETAINFEEIREKAVYYSGLYELGYSHEEIAYQMEREGFLGEHSISCGAHNNTTSITPNFGYYETYTDPSIYATELSWHNGTCVVCGVATWVGPCNICKPCESKL